MILTVKVEFRELIEDAIQKAITMSYILGVKIRFNFNETEVTVSPDSEYKEMIRKWETRTSDCVS